MKQLILMNASKKVDLKIKKLLSYITGVAKKNFCWSDFDENW